MVKKEAWEARVKRENRGKIFGGIQWTRDKGTRREVDLSGNTHATISSYSGTDRTGHPVSIYVRYERGESRRAFVAGSFISEVPLQDPSKREKALHTAFTIAGTLPVPQGTSIDNHVRDRINLGRRK